MKKQTSKSSEKLDSLPHNPDFLTTLSKNNAEKENVGNQHFVLFAQCFQLKRQKKLNYFR